MSFSNLELVLPDAPATEALGAALASAYLGAGAGSAVIYLHGELGAGKTTCARSLLRRLGVVALIRSPTYTLVETYRPGNGLNLIHVDLYRLEGADAVEELGLRDTIGTDSLLLLEWPEKGAGALPPPDLEVTLTYAGDSRRAWLSARSGQRGEWIAKLSRDTSLAPYVSNLT